MAATVTTSRACRSTTGGYGHGRCGGCSCPCHAARLMPMADNRLTELAPSLPTCGRCGSTNLTLCVQHGRRDQGLPQDPARRYVCGCGGTTVVTP